MAYGLKLGWGRVGAMGTSCSLILEDRFSTWYFRRECRIPGRVDSVNIFIWFFSSLSHVGAEFFHYSVLMDSNLHNSGFLGSE